ncbi:MAG TPA: sulfite exporter TauE/SafE family protein [Terriglobales bacterium]|nr:sulfite exporter TauE/SafE family protein [Terriglobales bacterium]
MSPGHAIFLLAAGALGGAMNAVAGGGSFVGFPALMFAGVPPISANASNTVALWMGMTASSGAYRRRLSVPGRVLIPLLLAAIAGGAGGAVLLLHTPARTFLRVIPWLLLAATLLFIFGGKLARGRSSVGHETTLGAIATAACMELAVATYGGYFGGGMGIVILAMLSAMGMSEIHSMNALKSVLSAATNGVAVIAFVIARAVYWPEALVMLAGAAAGGYFGAHYALRLPQTWVRGFVILAGVAMTTYFFVKAY